MAVHHLTLVEYIPRANRSSKELELQEAIVRAHVARVNHARRSKSMSSSRLAKSDFRQWHNDAELVHRNLTLEEASFTHSEDAKDDKKLHVVKEVTNPLNLCLATTVRDAAVNFTLTNLIQGSYFEYIPELCTRASAQGTLSLALECFAFATFAQHTKQDDLLAKARSLHQKTLRRIITALDDSEIACQDETLASVMLMAYFGLVAGHSPPEITSARDKHLNGAVSILRMRSSKGITSDFGDQMVLQIWDNVILRSHCNRERIPTELCSLQVLCLSILGNKKWKTGSGGYIYAHSKRLANFRAAVREKSLVDSIYAIGEALELLASNRKIYSEMHDIWPYTTCSTDSAHEGIYRGVYHMYPNGESAWMLNGLCRMTTIWLCSAVIDFSQRLLKKEGHGLPHNSSPAIEELIRKSQSEVERVALEICASVPQHLDPSFAKDKYRQLWMRRVFKQSRFKSCPKLVKVSLPVKKEISPTDQKYVQNISSACSLIWPLYVAGGATVSEALRSYAIHRLRYIGNCCNVEMANVAAARLTDGDFENEDGLDMAYAI